MNALTVFENSQFGQIRVIDKDGEPWFVAADVCVALELGNPRTSIALLDDDEKGVHTVDTPGGPQEMLIINEPGLYSLVLRSRKPEAKVFKRWICHEVIPSIRRTGGFIAAPADATPEEIMARAVMVANDTINRLKEKTAALESRVEADKPKVIFADSVAASPNCILVRELAKYLRQNGIDIGGTRLYAWLRDNGYLIKSGSDYNQPTQRAMDMGLFEVKKWSFTHSDGRIETKPTTKITGKGQQYFVNKFLAMKTNSPETVGSKSFESPRPALTN